MSDDFLPINRVDHIEFYVGNARQAAHYYKTAFGFAQTAYSGLETGNRARASYVLEQHNIRLVLSSALSPDHPIARLAHLHGDTVAVVGGVASHPSSVWRLDLAAHPDDAGAAVDLRPTAPPLAAEWVSLPRSITFPCAAPRVGALR